LKVFVRVECYGISENATRLSSEFNLSLSRERTKRSHDYLLPVLAFAQKACCRRGNILL